MLVLYCADHAEVGEQSAALPSPSLRWKGRQGSERRPAKDHSANIQVSFFNQTWQRVAASHTIIQNKNVSSELGSSVEIVC